MESPFPKSSSAPGEGHIRAKVLPNGQSGLEAIAYQYPLKLISPSNSPEDRSVLVFLLSYGGGLVGGDTVNLSIDIDAKARLSIVTQGHTKIFKSASPDIVTGQKLKVYVAPGAALCLLPDPVQPFEGSVYQQTQSFRLSSTASLCLLDWVTQGRTARGEDWSLIKWVGRNEIWALPEEESDSHARLLVRDTVILDQNHMPTQMKSLRERMHGLSIFGTLLLRGPLVKALGDFFLAEFAALPRLGARDFRTAEAKKEEDSAMSSEEKWRSSRLQMEKENSILWSAANVRGCVVVKFGAATVEAGLLLYCQVGDPEKICEPRNQRIVSIYRCESRCTACAKYIWTKRGEDSDANFQDEYDKLDASKDKLSDEEVRATIQKLTMQCNAEEKIREKKQKQEQEEMRAVKSWAYDHAFTCLGMAYAEDLDGIEDYAEHARRLEIAMPASVQIKSVIALNEDSEAPVDDDEAAGIRKLVKERDKKKDKAK